METTRQGTSPQPPSFAAALQRLWERHLAEIEERLAAIESATAAAAARVLTPEQKQAAHAAAHKLAGALGSFGLEEATAPAREIEHLYSADDGPSHEKVPRLIDLAASLRAIVENRKRPQPAAK